MDTPQGTFYRVYFDIYLTLDGSEFNAELVCQGKFFRRTRHCRWTKLITDLLPGEVMGRCSARFR